MGLPKMKDIIDEYRQLHAFEIYDGMKALRRYYDFHDAYTSKIDVLSMADLKSCISMEQNLIMGVDKKLNCKFAQDTIAFLREIFARFLEIKDENNFRNKLKKTIENDSIFVKTWIALTSHNTVLLERLAARGNNAVVRQCVALNFDASRVALFTLSHDPNEAVRRIIWQRNCNLDGRTTQMLQDEFAI